MKDEADLTEVSESSLYREGSKVEVDAGVVGTANPPRTTRLVVRDDCVDRRVDGVLRVGGLRVQRVTPELGSR